MAFIGFYPGSFDPVTNGHLDIIARAARLTDKLVIGIGVHHGKTPLLDAQTRIALLKSECASAGGEIEIVTFDGLVVDAAKAHGATALIRGLRNGGDFDYEVQMAGMNSGLAPEIETIFLAASPGTGFIASSLVKQIAGLGGNISPFVPKSVAAAVAKAGSA